jgi:hypothetical protein
LEGYRTGPTALNCPEVGHAKNLYRLNYLEQQVMHCPNMRNEMWLGDEAINEFINAINIF